MSIFDFREIRKANILSCYNANDIKKSNDHLQHKYIRKEGDKYIYEEPKKDLHYIKKDINFEVSKTQNMTNLIEDLKAATQELKSTYLDQTKKWATESYKVSSERRKWRDIEWCNYFGLTPEIKNKDTPMEFLGLPKNFYNTDNSKKMSIIKKEFNSILSKPFDDYISREVKDAEEHYNSSILKLADRITKKGLVLENIKVTSSRIGQNIDIFITDGKLKVNAYTIIAEGIVQKPHYRYLVK